MHEGPLRAGAILVPVLFLFVLVSIAMIAAGCEHGASVVGPSRATAVVRLGPRGRSDVLRGRSAGPLRLLFPRAAGDAAWIVASSLGGGLVDGDDVALDVTLEAGATALVGTQSSTKVYRGSARQELTVHVGADASALVLPDPVVPFRGATVVQRTSVDLEEGASLVLCETLTAGRVAFGERWSAARIDSTLSIARVGRQVLLDRVLLDGAHGDVAARMRAHEALATCVLLGPRVAAAARDILERRGPRTADPLVVAVAALDDGCLVRIAGPTVEAVTSTVRSFLSPAAALLGEDPWSRRW